MIAQEEFAGTWNELKGKVKKEWGQLTDNDLAQFEGDFEQLVGLIQRKTGEARAQIEETMRSWGEDSEQFFRQASAAVQQYASDAVGAAREQLDQAETMVKRHPTEAVIVSFGTGLLLGLVVGLVTKSR